MNVSINLSNVSFDPTGVVFQEFDPATMCAHLHGYLVGWAWAAFVLALLALLWFGRRGWLSRLVKDEGLRGMIGLFLLTALALLLALLAGNIGGWTG